MKKKFEYKTLFIEAERSIWSVKFDTEKMDAKLNELGTEGWELVSAESKDLGGTSFGFVYTFKREI